jgi:hypothetical protein
MVTVFPAWLKPTWMRWRATWMPPRLDTFRWMVRSAGGSGAGPASRTPWSLCRWPGGMGQGRLRQLRWCTERRQTCAAFSLTLACVVVILRRLLRQAWTHDRCQTRPSRCR